MILTSENFNVQSLFFLHLIACSSCRWERIVSCPADSHQGAIICRCFMTSYLLNLCPFQLGKDTRSVRAAAWLAEVSGGLATHHHRHCARDKLLPGPGVESWGTPPCLRPVWRKNLLSAPNWCLFAISSLLHRSMGAFGIQRTVLPTQTLKQTTDQVDADRDCYGCPSFHGHTSSNAFTNSSSSCSQRTCCSLNVLSSHMTCLHLIIP